MKSSTSGDTISAKEFSGIVERHDLTYSYSDDHGVWKRGESSMAHIREIWPKVEGGQEVAKLVWNYWVLLKVKLPYAKQFTVGGLLDELGSDENETDS